MKEAIQYYATCNAIINETMLDIIQKSIDKPMELPLEGYFFKTLGELLQHIYISDMNWMASFLAVADYGMSIETDFGPVPAYGQPAFGDFASYRAGRKRLDEYIARYAEALDEKDLRKMATKRNRKGEKLEKLLWKCLFHFFNHQTHHRGQVSAVLDGLKIENNFSNMIFIE